MDWTLCSECGSQLSGFEPGSVCYDCRHEHLMQSYEQSARQASADTGHKVAAVVYTCKFCGRALTPQDASDGYRSCDECGA